MSTTELVLEPPCALINANQRLHFQAKAKLTKAWRDAAREAVPTLRPVVSPSSTGGLAVLSGFVPNTYDRAHITITYRFPTNHRREVSNLQPTSKAIVDGLVDAGVVIDDDDLHVVGPDNRREYPNGPLRVTVSIQELPTCTA